MSKIASFGACIFLSAAPVWSAPAQGLKTVQTSILHPPANLAGQFVPYINFGVGNPPQNITSILDTGSSDLVVPQTNSQICQDPQQQCTGAPFVTGSFSPNNSSGLMTTNIPVNATFANGVSLVGNYIQAPLALGASSSNARVALASTGFLPPMTPLVPIMGLGPPSGEATQNFYANVPKQLFQSGAINDYSFAVYMNDFRAPNGTILFGGIDTAKFVGKLQNAPILADNTGNKPSFVIPFSSVVLQSSNSSNAQQQDLTPKDGLPPVLIDSGNSGIQIPASSIARMAKTIGTSFNQQTGELGNVPCDLGKNGENLSFGFNNDKAIVNLPLSMIVSSDPTGQQQQQQQQQQGCFLPISPSSGDTTALGAPFMQAAYVVFDMQKQQLLMAQAVVNATQSNIQPLQA